MFNVIISAIDYAYETSLISVFTIDGFRHVFRLRQFILSIITYTHLLPSNSFRTLVRKEICTTPDSRKKAKPKILHIISSIELGGSQKIIFDIINNLSDLYSFYIISLRDKRMFDVDKDAIVSFRNKFEFLELLNRHNINIVHIHYYGDYFLMHNYLMYLCKYSNKNISIVENVNNPILAYRHPRIHTYVYVSKYTKSLQHRKGAQSREVVIYPGFDHSLFQTAKRKEEWINIGLVYRLTDDKLDKNAITMFVEIVQKAKVHVLFHVVGYGYNFQHYIKYVRDKGVRQNFIFHGFIEYGSIPTIYKKFDLFIAPVHTESFGVVVPYAMAMGIPVVAANKGALPEILGATGYLCNTRRALIDTTLDIVNSGKIGLKKEAIQRSKKLFSIRKMMYAYASIYRKLAYNSLVDNNNLIPSV